MIKNNTENNGIKNLSDKTQKKLENSIYNIELRQQEIQNLIATLQNNLNHIESIIQGEELKTVPNNEKIKNLRLAILKNISLIREMYDSYDGFEETKFKYRKLITETDFNYQKLEIGINQTNEKINKFSGGDLVELLRSISSNLNDSTTPGEPKYINKIKNSMALDPELQL